MDKNTKLIVRQGVGYDHLDTDSGETVAYDLEEADARRIVACVNACAGLTTDYLETVGLPEFVGKTLCADLAQQELDRVTAQCDQLKASLDKIVDKSVELEQQRDQLLAAIEGVLANCLDAEGLSAAYANARAAIAAVKKGGAA